MAARAENTPMSANGRLARRPLTRSTDERFRHGAPKIKRHLDCRSTRQVICDPRHWRMNRPGCGHRGLDIHSEDRAKRRHLLLDRLLRLPRFLWLLASRALGDALRHLEPSPVFALRTKSQKAC